MRHLLLKTFMGLMAVILSVTVSLAAQAANIYKPGTEGDGLFKNVQDILPEDVVIVYLMKDDRGRFLKQVDANAFSQAGLTTKTIDAMLDRVSPKLTAESGIRAYTVTGKSIPGNEIQQKYFSVVVTNQHWLNDKGTMFHESLHAKNTYVRSTDKYRKAVFPAWKLLSGAMTSSQFISLLDEAVVAGQQVAYTYNEGRPAGLEMIQKYATADHNGRVSIGFRTARHMLEKCGRKGACPTDTIAMIDTIVKDPVILNDLIKDMNEIMAASKKMGVVVADQ
ncbi:hypothetical protein V0M98_38565 (plasmid) [Pseudomonas silesiensis]|uniref:hypothetical protein n=1 Tax=Pseudomonas silesiensis TaxID=1853130 RepID=UPI0030D02D35